MTRFLGQVLLATILLLAAGTAHAQKVPAPARPGVAQHYLLTQHVGVWRHSSSAMGNLTLTLGSNGTYRFEQVKGSDTKRIAGEYAFMDAPGGTRTDLLLFSGPRAADKMPSVRWSYSSSGKDAMTLRSRAFYRAPR
jgi:hypothetical protein